MDTALRGTWTYCKGNGGTTELCVFCVNVMSHTESMKREIRRVSGRACSTKLKSQCELQSRKRGLSAVKVPLDQRKRTDNLQALPACLPACVRVCACVTETAREFKCLCMWQKTLITVARNGSSSKAKGYHLQHLKCAWHSHVDFCPHSLPFLAKTTTNGCRTWLSAPDGKKNFIFIYLCDKLLICCSFWPKRRKPTILLRKYYLAKAAASCHQTQTHTHSVREVDKANKICDVCLWTGCSPNPSPAGIILASNLAEL